MKNSILILILFNWFCGFAQMPKNLIVVAENLNFREKPTTQSRVIDQLDNSERLERLELLEKWIKVRRKMTGEVGYVFWKYVLPQNIAYPNFSDAERIQTGNWYGIIKKKNQLIFEPIVPTISVEKDKFIDESYIHSKGKKSEFIFCTQEQLDSKKMKGRIIESYQGESWISVNEKKSFKFSEKIELTFESAGVEHYSERAEQEQILLTISYPKKKHNFDLTKDLGRFGEGYSLKFLGDLNNDGIPDFLLQEATTHNGAFYFFMSNENEEIELQSVTWTSSKC